MDPTEASGALDRILEPVGVLDADSACGKLRGRVSVVVVRLQEFWSRLGEQFGSMRAETVARDHVFSSLGGGGAVEAIDAGLPVRKVWLAICEEFEVPPKQR